MMGKLKSQNRRIYPFPATIVQRFSAGILDIGILLGLLIWAIALYHWLFDIPLGVGRYRPPHPSMGWSRFWRSVAIWSVPLLYTAFFTSSRLQATPGMIALHLKVMRTGGETMFFLRALGRIIFAFLPLIVANFLVLAGIALRFPLIYLGPLNLFSLLLILQCLWFLPIFSHRHNRGIPDFLFDTKVMHFADSPEGLPLARRIIALPILFFILALLGTGIGMSGINLLDQPLDARLGRLAEMDADGRSLWRERRQDRETVLEGSVFEDARCASFATLYRLYNPCSSFGEIEALVTRKKDIIDLYRRNILEGLAPDGVSHYLAQQHVVETDIVLADLIIKQQRTPEDDEPFREWLKIAGRWRHELYRPGPLLAKSYAFLHYNHVLLTLPGFVQVRPDFADTYAHEIGNAIEAVPLDRIPLDGIIAHEYALYEAMLEVSQFRYYPFIQPNATRNRFLTVLTLIEERFEQGLGHKGALALPPPGRFYNPLGSTLANIALGTWESRMHPVSTYYHNNGLKAILRLYIQAVRDGIKPEQMPAYLATRPAESRLAFPGRTIEWDGQRRALYYHIPGFARIRRYLYI